MYIIYFNWNVRDLPKILKFEFYMTHPTPAWHTPPPPLHDPPHNPPTPPHPWNIFGKNIPGFHGLLDYVSLSVDKNWHGHVVDKILVVNWIGLKCLEICNKSKLGDPCNTVWNYCHVFVCTENFQSWMISIGFIQFQPVSVQHQFLESKLKILNFQNSN